MALVHVNQGMYWPEYVNQGISSTSSFTLSTAANQRVCIGHCYIAGRAASKTISAAGGGKIAWHASTITFANAGTTLTIGIQDVDTTTGQPARSDGTFDVSRSFTGGGGGITANVYNETSMSGGSGSKTIAHGDLIAIVFDMPAKGGSDSVAFFCLSVGTRPRPGVSRNASGTWSADATNPNCGIVFDDGTYAILDGSNVCSQIGGTDSFSDSTNPDERGMIFQVPWDCRSDGCRYRMSLTTPATADHDVKLYSDPLGTPTLMTSVTVPGESSGNSSASFYTVTWPSLQTLSKNTDYVLAIKATGTTNVALTKGLTLSNTAYRAFMPGGTTIAKATRNNSTGAFTLESPALTYEQLAIRLCDFHNGA